MEDHEACKLIALSVGSVMRQSLDNSFKEECKKLLQAANTKMAEDILYKKLKETIQMGSCHSAVESPAAEVLTTSLPIQEELSRNENDICKPSSSSVARVTSSTVTTSTLETSSKQRNIKLGQMYCRTIQLHKRSLSPQRAVKPSPVFKLRKSNHNSAPI